MSGSTLDEEELEMEELEEDDGGILLEEEDGV
jgi:hypothetical protein